MNVRKALIGAMLVLAAGAAGSAQAAHYDVNVTMSPPPDRVEHVPPPRNGYVWDQGYWRWDHGHHIWVRGHWIHERHGHHWVNRHWVNEGERWRLEGGHWE
jgi:hypothetical protein